MDYSRLTKEELIEVVQSRDDAINNLIWKSSVITQDRDRLLKWSAAKTRRIISITEELQDAKRTITCHVCTITKLLEERLQPIP